VVLWSALYGVHPFPGDTSESLRSAVLAGQLALPARRNRVPRWLLAILLRGLETDPDRRWPALRAQLDELERRAGARRRTSALAGALVVASTIAVVGLRTERNRADAGPHCELAGDEVARVWNPDARQRIASAFQASTRPHAATTLVRVTGELEHRAAALAAARVSVCEATHVRGEQSAGILDLRMECLDRHLDSVRALIAVFAADRDNDLIDRAYEAVDALPGAQDCEATALAGRPLPPPGARARVQEAEHQLADAQALFDAGKYDGAARILAPLVDRARAIAYPRLVADALELRARVVNAGGDAAAATAAYHEAALAAAAAQDDRQIATAWLDEVAAIVNNGGDAQGAVTRLPFAEVAVARTGAAELREEYLVVRSDVEFAQAHYDLAVADLEAARTSSARRGQASSMGGARITSRLASALAAVGRNEEALVLDRRVLAAWTESLGPDHPKVAAMLNNVAKQLDDTGRYEEARQLADRALSIKERTFGTSHLKLAITLDNIANIASHQGRYPEMTAATERALAIRERALGPQHPDVGQTLSNLAEVRGMAGRFVEALELCTRAVAIHEHARGPDHPDVATSLASLARAELNLGKLDAAAAAARRSLAIRERALGAGSPAVADSLNVLADVLAKQHREQEACAARARAVDVIEKAEGKDHPLLTSYLAGHAMCLLEIGTVVLARTTAERAVAIGEHKGVAPDNLAAAQFALARALWRTPADRTRAIVTAVAARAHYAAGPAVNARDTEEVTRWLAAHPAPRLPSPRAQ
jgi:serine/threonine-protein kinase